MIASTRTRACSGNVGHVAMTVRRSSSTDFDIGGFPSRFGGRCAGESGEVAPWASDGETRVRASQLAPLASETCVFSAENVGVPNPAGVISVFSLQPREPSRVCVLLCVSLCTPIGCVPRQASMVAFSDAITAVLNLGLDAARAPLFAPSFWTRSSPAHGRCGPPLGPLPTATAELGQRHHSPDWIFSSAAQRS